MRMITGDLIKIYIVVFEYYSTFNQDNLNLIRALRDSKIYHILPSSFAALLLKGIAISSVLLERASLYCAADQSFNLSSISGVQHVGPVGQICSDTPKIKKNRGE